MSIEVEHKKLVESLAKPGHEIVNGMMYHEGHMVHMALLLAGEVGELVDAIKKGVIYKKDYDYENILEELGDIEFALCAIREIFGFSRNEVIKANISKLTKRYPSGSYSNEQAINRADKQ